MGGFRQRTSGRRRRFRPRASATPTRVWPPSVTGSGANSVHPRTEAPTREADLGLQRGLRAPPGFRLPLEPARSWLSLLGGASFSRAAGPPLGGWCETQPGAPTAGWVLFISAVSPTRGRKVCGCQPRGFTSCARVVLLATAVGATSPGPVT
jgi:hypothetical protein